MHVKDPKETLWYRLGLATQTNQNQMISKVPYAFKLERLAIGASMPYARIMEVPLLSMLLTKFVKNPPGQELA